MLGGTAESTSCPLHLGTGECGRTAGDELKDPDAASIKADTGRLERMVVDAGFESGQNIGITDTHNFSICGDCAFLIFSFSFTAGLPALHGSEPGQVRKEAATAIFCKCRGSGSPPFLCRLGGWTSTIFPTCTLQGFIPSVTASA